MLNSSVISGENEKIVDLKYKIEKVNTEFEKMELINLLTSAYYDLNIDSVEKYASISLNYGKSKNNPAILSNGLHQLGIVAEKRGHIEEAIHYFIQGLHIRDSLKNNFKIASSNLSLGNIHIAIGGDYESQNLVNESNKAYLKAQEFYQTALQYAIIANDSLLIHDVYTNLGFAHDRLYQYKYAIDNYELCYQWVPVKLKPSKKSLIKLKILSAQSDSGLLDKTVLEKEYEVLTKDFTSRNEISNLIYCHGSFANMVWDFDINLAELYFLRADSLAKDYGSVNHLAPINLNLYDLNKERGNHKKALAYYELYTKYSNQIHNSDSKSKFDELLIKYETEKTEKELIQTTANKNKWRLAMVISLVLLIGLATFFFQRQRINKLKRKEEKDQHNKQVNDLIQNQELASVEAMLIGQDAERQRIAEDLHDRLGSTLSAAKMYFEIEKPENTTAEAKKAIELVDKAINETRDIAQNLVSGVLSKFGLRAALNDLKNTIEGAGKIKINIEFNSQFERLKSDVEIQLYRIIQEIFSNALKHSNASVFEIKFNQNQNEFHLTVSDNGRGFEQDKVDYGMGITNINARVSKLNGTVNIDSSKAGTTFNIQFKLNNFES